MKAIRESTTFAKRKWEEARKSTFFNLSVTEVLLEIWLRELEVLLINCKRALTFFVKSPHLPKLFGMFEAKSEWFAVEVCALRVSRPIEIFVSRIMI